MRVIKSIKSIRRLVQKAKSAGKTVGFVPTMGALHEGHVSLLRRCRRENDIAVLSIFVNPAQFGPREDFARYPRPRRLDKMLAKREKVDIIFMPTDKTMYPDGYLTTIDVAKMTQGLCGKFRPGHFKGVTTVVGKLLNIVMPDRLYLGQKDAQQAVVLRQMVRDLNYPVTVRICPTIREKNGLAMSSRNRYLNERQYREATALYRALQEARRMVKKGSRKVAVVVHQIRSRIRRESSAVIDYIACVDAHTLEPLKIIRGEVLIALAVRFGKTRLIDNVLVHVP